MDLSPKILSTTTTSVSTEVKTAWLWKATLNSVTLNLIYAPICIYYVGASWFYMEYSKVVYNVLKHNRIDKATWIFSLILICSSDQKHCFKLSTGL